MPCRPILRLWSWGHSAWSVLHHYLQYTLIPKVWYWYIFSMFTALQRSTYSKYFPAFMFVVLGPWNGFFNMRILLQALTIESSTAVIVRGLTIQNSQQMNFVISRCDSVRISQVLVSAPGDSPNTDGIHITASTNVVLQDSKIGTGLKHFVLSLISSHSVWWNSMQIRTKYTQGIIIVCELTSQKT